MVPIHKLIYLTERRIFMYIKKDNGLTPVIATILLIALSVVLISVVSLSVMSGINSFIPAENKVVGFTVVVNDNDTATVTPVSGKDFPYLQSYTVYLDNGYIQNVSNVLSGEIITNFDENVTRINIAGNFIDGMTALVFSGKVVNESGEIVVKSMYYIVGQAGYDNPGEFASSINEWYKEYYGVSENVIVYDSTGGKFTFSNDEPILIGGQPINISRYNIDGLGNGNLQVTFELSGGIKRAPGYTGPLLVIGEVSTTPSNQVSISGTFNVDGDKINTSALSPAIEIKAAGILIVKGSLYVSNNSNSNTLAPNGGGIYVNDDGKLAVNGGHIYISNNYANGRGGGIYVETDGTFTDKFITYSGNSAGVSGTENLYHAS